MLRSHRLIIIALAGVLSLSVLAGAGAQGNEPAARFVGSVSIDGKPAAAGTSLTAIVNGVECGSATIITSATGARYVIDVPSNCADVGDIVVFLIGADMYAAETGTWDNTSLNMVDLSYHSAPRPECPEGWEWDSQNNECAPGEPSEEPSEPAEPEEPIEPAEPETVNVEVRVWQRIANPLSIYISARPEGDSWNTLGTIPLPLDDGFSSSGTYRYGDITVAGVEVRVWQRASDPLHIQISARPEGGSWTTLGTIPIPLDDGISSDGRYRYGDITVAVPLPDLPPEPVEPVDRSQCRIDEAMAARVIASTVKVITPAGTGSAFYVGNGEFVTAAHVVDDRPAWITLRNERVEVSARIVGHTSPDDGDLALLSASAPGMVALKWAGEIGAGAEVAVVGYPLGVGLNASISQGIVSRVFTDSAGVSQIQTDAPANPGNSGGPLVDACGRVAGVTSWKIFRDSQGEATEGLAFVVGEPSLSRLLNAIRSGQYVPPAGTSPSEPTWQEIHALINRVGARATTATDALNVLTAQWNTVIAVEYRPSHRLASIAWEQYILAVETQRWLYSLRSDPALRSTTVKAWWDASLRRWTAEGARFLDFHEYALNRTQRSQVEKTNATARNAYTELQRAECDLWRLQRYASADEVCAAAGR